MKYARISNNEVIETFIEEHGFTIEECFHPDIVSTFIPCPDNIDEGDFYDPDTQEFAVNPNKKLPNYPQWANSLTNKQNELQQYSLNIIPIINGVQMSIEKIDEYKDLLKVITDDPNNDTIEFEGNQFTENDFILMIDALEMFYNDKSNVQNSHHENIILSNNALDIDAYDFTSGWPETNISIQTT